MTILLGTTLLASGPMYADAVYLAGAQRTLQDAEPATVSLLATTRARGPAYDEADARITAALEPVISGGGEIVRSGVSDSYALPGQATVSSLTVFQFRDALDSYATLVDGRWPQETGMSGRVEAALPSAAAELLRLRAGDTLTLPNRIDRTEVEVTVSGVFEIDTPGDRYWHAETMAIEGLVEGASFDTYGPFFVPRQSFLDTFTTRPATMSWQAFPAFVTLAVADLPQLRHDAGLAAGRANAGRGDAGEVTVATGIPAIIADIERSLLATRSGVLILSIQLALLAAYALFLTANILVEQRAVETALARSRGAGIRHMLTLSAFEGLLLVVPAVLLGPPLASLLLRLLNRVGPLSGIGLTLRPELTNTSWGLSLAAGAACLLLLTLPATFSARSVLNARAAKGRESGSSFWRRGGLDVVFVAIAAIGFLQLRRYGSPITETVQGRVDIDPLLVAAPALGLLAGAVIALRLIPWVGVFVERVTTGGQRAALALGGWQIGRRPLRYSRSALLLTLALGIGLFGAAYTTTWQTSQDDQAGYQTGADIRLQPSRRLNAISEMHLTSAHTAIDGVTRSTPVDTYRVSLSRATGSATIVVLDADTASELTHFRDDLADETFTDLMERLVTGRPRVATIPLPGEPRRIALDITAWFPPPCPEPATTPDGPVPPLPEGFQRDDCVDVSHLPEFHPMRASFHPSVYPAIVLRDGAGAFHTLRAAALAGNGSQRRYVFTLVSDAGHTPVYPLEVAAIELHSNSPSIGPITDLLTLHDILASDDPSGDAWSVVPYDGGWSSGTSIFPQGMGVQPTVELATSDDGLVAARFTTGVTYASAGLPVTHTFWPQGSEEVDALPAIVSARLLELASIQPGDRMVVDFAGGERALQVVGTLDAFPSLDPLADIAIVIDAETLGAVHLSEPGTSTRPSRERWLAVDDDQAENATEALASAPFSSPRVESRVLRSQTLRADPVALGTIGALSIGFIAAAVFAIAGFVISVVTTTRERLTEFALLRAIGLSPRQLAASLLFENGVLVAVSLIAGTALGLLLAWLVLPLITVSRAATGVFPTAIVVIPWMTITLLEAGIVLALLVASALIVLSLRRRGLGIALRIGED